MAYKEKVTYQLRRARIPQSGYALSGVVVISTPTYKTRAYVKFSEALVRAAGLLLPEGISRFRPAYLSLIQWGDGWRLYVRYLEGGPHRGLLVEYGSTPRWADREVQYAESKAAKAG